eukprot:gene23984-47063_t
MCITAGFFILTYAVRWEMRQQRNFFVMCAWAFGQEIMLNEPTKLLVLRNMPPPTVCTIFFAEEFANTFLGAAIAKFLEQTGILKAVQSLLS